MWPRCVLNMSDNQNSSLNEAEELERLRQLFQETLDSVTAETAQDKAESEAESKAESKPPRPKRPKKSELCPICKTRARAEGRSYCEECEHSCVGRRPIFLSYLSVVLTLILLCFTVALTAYNFKPIAATARGDRYFSQGKMSEAQAKYYSAARTGFANGLPATRAVSGYGLSQLRQGDVEAFFSAYEMLSQPKLNPFLHKLNSEAEDVSAYKEYYLEFSHEYTKHMELDYNSIIAKLEEKLRSHDSTAKDYPLVQAAAFSIGYQVALDKGQGREVCIEYLERISHVVPKKLYHYADSLVMLYAYGSDRQRAEELCRKILKYNAQSPAIYYAGSVMALLDGDYKGAAEECDKGLERFAEGTDEYYELLRRKAIALMLDGNKTAAYELVKDSADSYRYEQYVLTVVLCLEFCDRSEEAEALEGRFLLRKNQELEAYRQGKITLEDIFLSGDYDLTVEDLK